jgi:hypothetical protein
MEDRTMVLLQSGDSFQVVFVHVSLRWLVQEIGFHWNMVYRPEAQGSKEGLE